MHSTKIECKSTAYFLDEQGNKYQRHYPYHYGQYHIQYRQYGYNKASQLLVKLHAFLRFLFFVKMAYNNVSDFIISL